MTHPHRIHLIALVLCIVASGTHGLAQPVYVPNRGAPPPSGYSASPNGRTADFGMPPTNQNYLPGTGARELPAQPSARIAMSGNTGGPVDTWGNASPNGAGTVSEEASSSMIRTNNFTSIIREGGVLMIPILFCSFVLFVFVLERLLFLRRGRVIPKPFVRGVIEQLEQQQLEQEEALELCQQNGSPTAELFTAALKKFGRPAIEIEQAVVDAGAHIASNLRRYLRLFSAISNLTPLLGLLGTVLGMIDAFNSIAQADAMGRPELLASGIGAALLTTASGLSVAIPAYAAYAYFLARTDKLLLEMDSLVASVVELTSAEALQGNRGRTRSRKAA